MLFLDPRGTGGSDRPADAAAYELADYASDVEEVRRQLGLERLDLLGHSHGGFVAMTWASTYPQSVGRLVLASTAARFSGAIRAARAARVALRPLACAGVRAPDRATGLANDVARSLAPAVRMVGTEVGEVFPRAGPAGWSGAGHPGSGLRYTPASRRPGDVALWRGARL